MSNINITELLRSMTVEEKIGQLVQLNAAFIGDSRGDATGPLAELGISKEFTKLLGSTLNFFGPDEMIELQKKHLEDDPHKIPLLFMMDVIHGYRTIYPIPLAMGASFDPDAVDECSRMASKEASAGGINVTFTPMVDYVRDARWGRVMETCGEDPYLNSIMGAVQVKAFQGDDLKNPDNIAACVKHFAAYGGAEAGRDYNTVEISERLLRECYFPAYKACIDAGVKMLMPSFNSLSGVPSVANYWLMNDVLRKEWGFNGIVISDYNAIGELLTHGVAGDLKEACEMSFNNGCDIEMMSAAYAKHLAELIKEGKVDMDMLNDSVEKVLRLKEALGLFDDPFRGASPEKEASVCLTDEHRDIARRAAEGSAVLLKNDGILPFPSDVKKVALIGPFASEHAIRGSWSCYGKDSECVSVEEGIRALLPGAEIKVAKGCEKTWGSTSKEGFDEAVAIAKEADIVILCLGEPHTYSGEGSSRAELTLPGVQDALAAEIAKVNPNTAAVLFNGRPLVLTELDKNVPAILEMFFPGNEGGNAAANLLFGKAVPSGKVSMSFPKAVGQCPIYYNHPRTGRPKPGSDDSRFYGYTSNYVDCGNLPLYSFGHGLSYTSFTYESLELDKNLLTYDENDSIKVTVTVTNSGKYDAKEVVQLYLFDKVASAVRPIQSLIGFNKVFIKAGETKQIEFTVSEEMLRFWNFDCEFESEPGEFTLSTGYADHLKLTKSFWLK